MPDTPKSGTPEPGTPAPDAIKPDRRVAALRRFALSITVFTVAGHLFLGFEQAYLTPVVAVLTAYAVELVFDALDATATGRRPWLLGGPAGRNSPRDLVDFLLPAHIGGLACAMLLYGNARLMPTVFAVVVAVTSKYVLRVPVNGRPRHFMNPSNLGIVVTLLLFPWVGIAPPYQFTEHVTGVLDWAIPLAILAAGTFLNGKLTGRLPLIAGWAGGFAAQAVFRWAFTDDVALLSALLPMTGVAFVIYTNYMITDPGTTPSRTRDQVLFGLATAAAYGVLVQFHVVFGMFFALAIVCALRGMWHLARSAVVARRRSPGTSPAPGRAAVPQTAG